MKCERKITIKTPQGLHVRPAMQIVKVLQSANSSVFFTHRKNRVNAKSIMSILALALGRNTKLTIDAEGDDAEEIVQKLAEILENKEGV